MFIIIFNVNLVLIHEFKRYILGFSDWHGASQLFIQVFELQLVLNPSIFHYLSVLHSSYINLVDRSTQLQFVSVKLNEPIGRVEVVFSIDWYNLFDPLFGHYGLLVHLGRLWQVIQERLHVIQFVFQSLKFIKFPCVDVHIIKYFEFQNFRS